MFSISSGIQTLMYGPWEIIYGAISLIPKVAYLLAQSFLAILDVFQLWMRKLAGLDVYYVDGEAQTGDIVYQFIRGTVMGDYTALTNVFIGLLILGVILLFLSTIIAIIRNEYTAEKDGNSKAKIIGQSFKSIFYFAIVPIVCLFGVYLANIVLVAVDKATSLSSSESTILDTSYLEPYVIIYNDNETAGGSETSASDSVQSYIGYNFFGFESVGSTTATFSGIIFKASCYGANRVRLTENQAITVNNNGTQVEVNGFFEMLNEGYATNFNGLFKDEDLETLALYIDVAFADNVKLNSDAADTLDYSQEYIENYNAPELDPFAQFQQGILNSSINRFNVTTVWYYYDLWHFDFIVCFGAGIIMVTVFVNIIFGLIKRLIELIGLFIIAAPLIALFPLDNGGAYGKWRKSFMSKTLMAYGAIGGINIIFLILPYLKEISFFNDVWLDAIATTIISIVALMDVKNFIAMISDFAGGENAEKEGGGIAGEAGKMVGKAAMLTTGVAAGGVMAGKVLGKGALKALSAANTQRTAKKRFGADSAVFNKTMGEKETNFLDEMNAKRTTVNNEYNTTRNSLLDEQNSLLNPTDAEISKVADSYENTFQYTDEERNDPVLKAQKRKKYEDDAKTYLIEQNQKKHKKELDIISNKLKQASSEHDKNINAISDETTEGLNNINKERGNAPDLYDYKVHGLRKGAWWQNTKRGAGYTASTLLPPLATVAKASSFDDNAFTKGVSEGASGKLSGSIKDMFNAAKSANAKKKKEFDDLVKKQKQENEARKAAGVKSQEDMMNEVIEQLKKLNTK